MDNFDAPGATLDGPPLHEDMHQDIIDAVEAMQTELGLSPSGAAASVAARFSALDAIVDSADQIWLPANVFTGLVGATLSSVGTYATPAMVLDAAAAGEALTTATEIPSWWTTFDVDLYWTHNSASSGNVVWQNFQQFRAAGASLVGAVTAGLSTIAVGAQAVVIVSTIRAAVVNAAGICTIYVERLGSNGADTYPFDAYVLGINLRRAS